MMEADELIDSLPSHLRNKVLETMTPCMEPDEPPANHRVRRAAMLTLLILCITSIYIGRLLVWAGTKLKTFLEGKFDSNRLTS